MCATTINHIDIPAHDRHGTAAFYQGLFGWEYTHYDDAHYTMYRTPAGVAGGYPRLSGPQFRAGRIIPQVDSQDIQANLQRAQELGAAVVREETEIPYVGAFALIEDPCGNPLSFFSDIAGKQTHPQHQAVPGALAALVYPAQNRQTLANFYHRLLGWEAFEHDETNQISWCQTDSIAIGLTPLSDTLSRRGEILLHVHSQSVTDDLQKAAALGGRILKSASRLPDGRRFGLFADLSGNRLALLQAAS